MRIHGFQKLTLLDYPGKTACTVFTGGCNLRCPFCHNAQLVLNPGEYPLIPEEEVFALLEKRRNTIEGVCITGGEPMLMKDLPEFAEKIKERGFSVKIDTNGSFPRALKYLVNSGLADYIAMDIKNCREKYPETVGRAGFDLTAVEESVEFLKSCRAEHEFRTTVCRSFHTAEDLLKIASWIGQGQNYYLQSFKDSGALLRDNVVGYTPSEMRALAETVRKVLPTTGLRGV